MDDFHYAVAIAGYVGAGVALLVAFFSAWWFFDPGHLEGDERNAIQNKAAAHLGVACGSALVLALLSSILMRLIE